MDRILGIDYGDVRTGIAVSDMLGITAQPVETINNNGNDEMLVARLMELIDEYKINRLVFGYPKNMNGTIGPRAEQTDRLIELLAETQREAGKEVTEVVRRDERLTSVIAEKTMTQLGVKKKNKRKIVDRIAAVQILQSYLDSGA